MKLNDIETNKKIEIQVSYSILNDGNFDFVKLKEYDLMFNSNSIGYYFETKDIDYPIYVDLIYKSKEEELDFLIRNSQVQMAHISSIWNENNTAMITIYFFSQIKEIEKLEVFCGSELLEKYNKDDEYFLMNNFTFTFMGKSYFIGFMGDFVKKNKNEVEVKDGFTLIGKDNISNITFEELGTKTYLNMGKLKSFKKPFGNLILFKGQLDFVDIKTELSKIVSADLGSIIKSNSSYIKIWDDYASLEKDKLITDLREFGSIMVKSESKESQNKYSLVIDKSFGVKLKKGMRLDVFNSIPKYLDSTISDEEAKKRLFGFTDEKILTTVEIIKTSIPVEIKKSSKEMKLEGKYLVLSFSGNKAPIDRQERAKESLERGFSEIAGLNYIITGSKNFKNKKRKKQLKVKQLKSEHLFNKNQKDAISIALNTPDIALIQGPPGTGKTTVCAAIIKQINDSLKSKDTYNPAQILITSYQHIAVENLVNKLSLNGIVVSKFGNSKNSVSKLDNVDEFIEKLQSDLKEKNPSLKNSVEQDIMENLFYSYINNPSELIENKILNQIIKFENFINEETFIRAKYLLELRTNYIDKNTEDLLLKVRGLRSNQVSYEDDGESRVSDVIIEDIFKLTDDEKKLLNSSKIDESYFNFVRNLQKKLLQKLIPRQSYLKSKPNIEILEIIKEVQKQLDQQKGFSNEIENSLYKFYMDIGSTSNMKSIISKYQTAFGSTIQQSERFDIVDLSEADNLKDVRYDSIIVDEAAKVNPRDLFIPMVKTKNRIILVGDHRQLPQMVEQDYINKLEKQADNDEEKAEIKKDIELSMFEYLKEKLEEQQERDNIPRVITLNEQYRMPKLLGDFVSRNFYEKDNEGFSSPSLIEPDTSIDELKNKCLAWVDVPYKSKDMKTNNSGSKSRKSEATALVAILKKALSLENKPDQTYGVITYYSAQVDVINKELQKEGILNSTLQLDDKYGNSKTRLKVGTVDSFQGTEFDVVFLSMVRTKSPSQLKKSQSISIYGHLELPNRLCVSMSRQKKALIVVGDSKLVDGKAPYKDKAVGLKAFYKLCKEEGMVI
jgi:hypothetical protein